MSLNVVSIKNDMSIFDGRLSYMRCAQQLLSVLVYLKKENNFISTNVKTLQSVLSDQHRTVCTRTIRGWLALLAKNGAIKYKYSGKIMVNPRYDFSGTLEDYVATCETYENFKSDVAEIEQKNAL